MLAFTDLETTDLPPETSSILEVAIVLTTDDLEEVARLSCPVKPMFGYCQMPDIVKEMHTKNGLWELANTVALRRYEVEQQFVDFVRGRVPADQLGKLNVAGNTVGFDLGFLRYHMPLLAALFHYRIVDVSSFNEVARRWHPKLHEGRPRSPEVHRALPDALNSLETLRYYRANGLFLPEPYREVVQEISSVGQRIAEYDLLKKMQEPGQRQKIEAAFSATPEKLGRAAVEAIETEILKEKY